MTLGRVLQATAVAAVAAGAFVGGALTTKGEAHAPAAVSAPLSSSDVAELRQDMRELRTAVVNLTDRLSKLEGRSEGRP